MGTSPVSDPAVEMAVASKRLPPFLRWALLVQLVGPIMMVLLCILAIIVLSFMGERHAEDGRVPIITLVPLFLFYSGAALALVPSPLYAALCGAVAWRQRSDQWACALCITVFAIEVLVTVILVCALSSALFYWRHPDYLDESLWPGSGVFTPGKDRF